MNPFVLLLLLTVGLGCLWRKRSEGRRWLAAVTALFATLVALSIPAVDYQLRGSLEWQYAGLQGRPADAEAIVVLGGGVHPADGPRSQAELDNDSLFRCLRVAELYHDGLPCPVLVSGGKAENEPGPACARVMHDFLLRLGVRDVDIIVEDRSRTTYENAVESRKLLAGLPVGKVVLVTSAIHLPRALACFRKQGVDAVPCGCEYRATPHDSARLGFVPSAAALQDCLRVCHEWGGMAWYKLRGRL